MSWESEHPWLVSNRRAVPVLPRRRHEIGQPVQEVTRREFDDAVSARPRRLPPTPRADPVGRPNDDPASREHVADASDATVGVADQLIEVAGYGRDSGAVVICCGGIRLRPIMHAWKGGFDPPSDMHTANSHQ